MLGISGDDDEHPASNKAVYSVTYSVLASLHATVQDVGGKRTEQNNCKSNK